jgi:hypothetical protein
MIMPGGITVTREALYTVRPTLDARILAHIEAWRESVPVGTAVTVDKMLNCAPGCGCPGDTITAACKGNRGHGMALEAVMDHLNPEGSVCAIPGIAVSTYSMPFLVVAVPLSPLLDKITQDLRSHGFGPKTSPDFPGFQLTLMAGYILLDYTGGAAEAADLDPGWYREVLERRMRRMHWALQLAGHRVRAFAPEVGDKGFQLQVLVSPWI